MIIEPDWPFREEIKAFCTTRLGFYSQGAYAHFNLGTHVGEAPEITAKNREALIDTYDLPSAPYWLTQTHSTRVIELNQYKPSIEADASFTRNPHQVCVVMTADCLPLLIVDKAKTVVAAVHAGWRGLCEGIIQNTITALAIDPQQLFVWLGPAISQNHFEVGNEVYEAFKNKGFRLDNAFIQHSDTTWRADLYALARDILTQLGVLHIFGGNYCTYAQDDWFYSYRRDGVTGRMASLIWL
jgi:polyphenol oxidase